MMTTGFGWAALRQAKLLSPAFLLRSRIGLAEASHEARRMEDSIQVRILKFVLVIAVPVLLHREATEGRVGVSFLLATPKDQNGKDW